MGQDAPGKLGEIAFLGMGLMGTPMARRLLDAGFSVRVWNRTSAKAEALAPFGARVCATPAEAASGAAALIVMLTDGDAVGEVLFDQGAAEALDAGGLVVDMSSIKPASARAHGARVIELGLGYVDAPVSGGTRGAEAGNLAIMAGGSQADFERARPLLAPLGRAMRVGPAGAGQLAKLANQAIVAINIGGVAEALLLAAAGGADPAAVRDAIRGGFAESRILEEHGGRMLARDFRPGGRITIHIKDLNNILDEAGHLGLRLPLCEAMLELFVTVRDTLNGGDFDHAAALLALEAASSPHRVGCSPNLLP